MCLPPWQPPTIMNHWLETNWCIEKDWFCVWRAIVCHLVTYMPFAKFCSLCNVLTLHFSYVRTLFWNVWGWNITHYYTLFFTVSEEIEESDTFSVSVRCVESIKIENLCSLQMFSVLHEFAYYVVVLSYSAVLLCNHIYYSISGII